MMNDEFGSITIDNKNLLNDLLNLEGTNDNELFLDNFGGNNNNNQNYSNNNNNNNNNNHYVNNGSGYSHSNHNNSVNNIGQNQNAANNFDEFEDIDALFGTNTQQQQQQQPDTHQPFQLYGSQQNNQRQTSQLDTFQKPPRPSQLQQHQYQPQQQTTQIYTKNYPIEQPALKHPDFEKHQSNEALLQNHQNGYQSGVSSQPPYSQKTSLQPNYQTASQVRKTTLESPTFNKVEEDIYRCESSYL
jgi:hypothetical protein